MRNSNTQLPTARELKLILESESQRKAVRFDFIRMHSEIYDVFKDAAASIGADTSWIENYPGLALTELSEVVRSTVEQLHAAIAARELDQHMLDGLFEALIVDDPLEPCEAIFVFGSPSDGRIAHAVELYRQSVAPVVIVSGKGPHYGSNELSEAERTAKYAIEHGVPEAAIMIEPESITLPDNVKRALDMFELKQMQPRRICIIATSYISQRARMEWYKFTPWDIEIISSPAPAQSPELQKETWYTSERGIRMLLNEYAKIVVEHKMDLVRRDE